MKGHRGYHPAQAFQVNSTMKMNSSKEESLLHKNNCGICSLINAEPKWLMRILITHGVKSLGSFMSMLKTAVGHRKETGDEFLEFVHKTIAEERYYLY